MNADKPKKCSTCFDFLIFFGGSCWRRLLRMRVLLAGHLYFGVISGRWRTRAERGKVAYPLDQILLLCPLAVLAGAQNFVYKALG
jgi:hypothetical protein